MAYNLYSIGGQSLAGGQGSTATSLTQLFSNKMLNTGVIAGQGPYASLQPLVESGTETLASAMTNYVCTYFPSSRIIVHDHFQGGVQYDLIRRSKQAYMNMLGQASAILRLSLSSGLGLPRPRLHIYVHGESDEYQSNAIYDQNLATEYANCLKDFGAMFGTSAGNYFMQACQTSSYTRNVTGGGTGGHSTPIVAPLQLKAAEDAYAVYLAGVGSNPSLQPTIVCPTSKYFMGYQSDGIHLLTLWYQVLGEYHGKVEVARLNGQVWTGCRPDPLNVTRAANVITINYFVPVAPLVFDTTNVPAQTNMGFEFNPGTGGNTPTISSVVIDGTGTKVIVTLSATPTGTGCTIGYAYTGTANALSGSAGAPRGNLRDSDTTVGPTSGKTLYNWSIGHWTKPII